MRNLIPLSFVFLVGLLACVDPTPSPTLAELNMRWIGQPMNAYMALHGKPKFVEIRPDGGKIATYRRFRKDPGPSGPRVAVNLKTGERSILSSDANLNANSDKASGTPGLTRVGASGTGALVFQCTTKVWMNTQGLIEKIERTGNDC